MKTYFIISIVIGFILTVATYAKNWNNLMDQIEFEFGLQNYVGILIGVILAYIINAVTWPIYIVLKIYNALLYGKEQEPQHGSFSFFHFYIETPYLSDSKTS